MKYFKKNRKVERNSVIIENGKIFATFKYEEDSLYILSKHEIVCV